MTVGGEASLHLRSMKKEISSDVSAACRSLLGNRACTRTTKPSSGGGSPVVMGRANAVARPQSVRKITGAATALAG